MRLFVAVTPPPLALDEMDAVVAPLRSSWSQVRWTLRPTWHLTLAFLGEVDEAAAEDLSRCLAEVAAGVPQFPLALAGGGAFPNGPSIAHHVFWAGLADAGKAELKTLADKVGEAAHKAGAPPPEDGRGFKPHLTLARCRAPVRLSPLVAAMEGFQGTPWPVTEILLAQSFLRPERPEARYVRLGQWPLAEAPTAAL
jgi:2'-5' RNA ligase